jgi:hypothetical protein
MHDDNARPKSLVSLRSWERLIARLTQDSTKIDPGHIEVACCQGLKAQARRFTNTALRLQYAGYDQVFNGQ